MLESTLNISCSLCQKLKLLSTYASDMNMNAHKTKLLDCYFSGASGDLRSLKIQEQTGPKASPPLSFQERVSEKVDFCFLANSFNPFCFFTNGCSSPVRYQGSVANKSWPFSSSVCPILTVDSWGVHISTAFCSFYIF